MDLPSYLMAVSSATQMYSGVGRVMFDWLRRAAPHFRLAVMMDMADPDNFRIAAEFCRAHAVPLHVSRTAPRPGTPDRGLARAPEIFAAARWDFVEIVSWASAAVALDVLAGRSAATRLVMTPHTQPLDTLQCPETQFLVRPAFDLAIASAALVCCTSQAELAGLQARYPGRDCFRYVPNGVDEALFHPDASARDGTVLSVFDAREHRKRPDLLWQAFLAAARRDPALRFVLAGRGTDRLTPPEALRGRTACLGYVAEDALLRLYRAARCLVLLSDFEAFGMPIAEAAMCGTPVVATRGEQQESLFAGLPGIELVDNRDAEAAAAAILRAGVGHAPSDIAAASRVRFGLAASYGRKLAALHALPDPPPAPPPPARIPGHRPAALPPHPAARPPAEAARPGLGRPLRVLHVSPRYFADASLIGGGERYVENVCRAVCVGAAGIDCSVLSFGPANTELRSASGTRYDIVAGRPEAPDSIDAAALDRRLREADIVHVHQCLTDAGMFAASHARLLGRRIIGSDHGGGEMPMLHWKPKLFGIYDAAIAHSRFGETAFLEFDVPLHRILGPVDDGFFSLGRAWPRDRSVVIAIGRILPHKGLHHIIDALPPGLSLVIAGRPYDPAYRRQLADRVCGKPVSFEEGLDDAGVLRLMQRAGLCVHFSTHTVPDGTFIHKPELLGLAPLECLCTGLPVLASTAGSLRELGELPGCLAIETASGLRAMLGRWAEGALEMPDDAAIRQAAVERYGLRQFGAAYASVVQGLA